MKKQFFYAVMALAVMSSCSKDNDPGVVPNPDEGNNDKMAIELGVSTPDISATTRGTGTVGSDDEATNQWDSQRLYIYMIDQATGEEAMDPKPEGGNPGAKILPNDGSDALTFIAPKKTDANITNSGDIRIYQTYISENDNGTIQYKYYPVSGKYTFFGFHVDDASVTYTPSADPTGTPTASAPTWVSTFTKDKKAVENIVINGTQDVLGAETVKLEGTEKPASGNYSTATLIGSTTWEDMVNNQFGAKTARNGIKPILKFDHKLARLKFYLRAGNPEAATHVWNATTSAWDERTTPTFQQNGNVDATTATSESGVYVTRISALNMTNIINLDFATAGVPANRNANAAPTTFDLMSTPTSGKNLVALTPIAPAYPNTLPTGATAPSKPNGVTDENFYKYTAIGESMMFFPDPAPIGDATTATNTEIKFQLDLGQVRIATEDETKAEDAADRYTYQWIKKQNTPLTLKASAVKIGNGNATAFEPGKSYNVYITIYGFERIEITAQLTAWANGGDIEADIEDEE